MKCSFLPVQVAEDGTVTHRPQTSDPRLLPWVTGAEDTLRPADRATYSHMQDDLKEKLSVLKSKRAKNGYRPHHYAWDIDTGTWPGIDTDDVTPNQPGVRR
jgi:hypothetical protein